MVQQGVHLTFNIVGTGVASDGAIVLKGSPWCFTLARKQWIVNCVDLQGAMPSQQHGEAGFAVNKLHQ